MTDRTEHPCPQTNLTNSSPSTKPLNTSASPIGPLPAGSRPNTSQPYASVPAGDGSGHPTSQPYCSPTGDSSPYAGAVIEQPDQGDAPRVIVRFAGNLLIWLGFAMLGFIIGASSVVCGVAQ